MSEKFSLKDELFNPQKVNKIATEIKEVYEDFKQKAFAKEVLKPFETLELKERIYHIRDMLAKYLPSDYIEATTILLKALPPELDPNKTDDDFGDFIYAPYGDFVATFGCTEEHLAFSLNALREISKRFSVEFAIRDFINDFPNESFDMLKECSLSENYHERRLASEGTRPKLPWAKKLTTDYSKPLALLENLYSDKTRYVTRSVANHLNDISKIDAPLVIETLKQWKSTNRQNEKEMNFIINHALRTLIKEGNKEALKLLGYNSNPAITIRNFQLTDIEVQVGEYLEFSFDIEAGNDEALIIDYIIYFQTKSGKLSPKVHKIKKLNLKKGKQISINKQHLFKANMTTRKLYTGEHRLVLQVNGQTYYDLSFYLIGR